MTEAPNMRDVLRSAATAASESDLERYRTAGARLLETAQAKLARAEHDYQMGRARILADARMQLDALRQRTRDELHAFDFKHAEAEEELHKQVQILLGMREVGH